MPATLAIFAAAALSIAAPATAIAQEPVPMPTNPEAANRALIENAFTRWGAGDFDIFSLLADDAVWHITGNDPEIAKTYRSRKALIEATSLPLRARLAGPLQPTVRGIWTDGDDVLVHWEGSAPLRDGSRYRNTYLWIMTVRGDRVTAVTAFLDNAAFKAALAKPLPAGDQAVSRSGT